MKKIYILSFVLLALLLTACSSQAYNEQKELAFKAIEEERYEDAKNALLLAIEKKDQEEDHLILEAVEKMMTLIENYHNGLFEEANLLVEEIENIESAADEIELLRNQAEEWKVRLLVLETQWNELGDLIEQLRELLSQKNYASAQQQLNEYENPEQSHAVLDELLGELSELEEKIVQGLNQENTQETEGESNHTELDENQQEEEKEKEEEVEQDTVSGNQDYEAPPGGLTMDEATNLVADFAGVSNHQTVQVQYDHENSEGHWVFQVFEVVIDNPDTNEGHSATWGWYVVNPSNGEIYDLMN
ncbi:hypothetical protein BTS2_0731 [Bacillus sp. TS-2]|nr:hypothetical protein BTS2_0731 [Bacillus sp. TS-2]